MDSIFESPKAFPFHPPVTLARFLIVLAPVFKLRVVERVLKKSKRSFRGFWARECIFPNVPSVRLSNKLSDSVSEVAVMSWLLAAATLGVVFLAPGSVESVAVTDRNWYWCESWCDFLQVIPGMIARFRN